MNKLDARFHITERGSTVRREIIGGVTTFATMAYILIVQASLMSGTGMNVTGVMISTALMSGLITLLMALYANLPFALGPGMGTNAIFAGLVAAGGATAIRCDFCPFSVRIALSLHFRVRLVPGAVHIISS